MVEISLLFLLIKTVRNAKVQVLPKVLSAGLLFPVQLAIKKMEFVQHALEQD